MDDLGTTWKSTNEALVFIQLMQSWPQYVGSLKCKCLEANAASAKLAARIHFFLLSV